MEDNLMVQDSNEVMELLSKLSMAHINFNNKFMEISNNFISIKNEVSSIKNEISIIQKEIDTRIYVSSGQRKVITKHVKDTVTEIASQEGWEYKSVSRKLFNAIYGEINNQYNVPSYTDLPAKQFEDIVYKIDNWKLNLFVKENIEMKLGKE